MLGRASHSAESGDPPGFRSQSAGVSAGGCGGLGGANLEEAGDGQSKPDFISKNCIALKEIREAKFWLRQLRDAEPKRLGPAATPLIEEAEELRLILTTIILNAKEDQSRGEED